MALGQVAAGLAAQGQVVEGDQDGEPVGRAAGRGQAIGEELRRAVMIFLVELDLAQEVGCQGHIQLVLNAFRPGQLLAGHLLQLDEGLFEQVAGQRSLVPSRQ